MRRTIAQSGLVFASVLLLVALAGCSSSKKTAATAPTPDPDPTPTPPAPTTIVLPQGHTLTTGIMEAGASQKVHTAEDGTTTVVTCPAGGAACVIGLVAGGASSTGGAIVKETGTTLSLPADHTLMKETIAAGGTKEIHDANGTRTVVECPAGGAACVIFSVTTMGAESKGGAASVTRISYTSVELPEGHTLVDGSTLQAGATVVVHGGSADAAVRTEVECPAGGEACKITLTENGAESTGGRIMVVSYGRLADLPEGHTLRSGTIAAGASAPPIDIGGRRTTVTCPADGADCVITVNADQSAESTGGTPTVVTTVIMTPIELPEGVTLAAGTIEVGKSETLEGGGRTVVVACPSGDGAQDCEISVDEDGNPRYARTGGTPTIEVTVNMSPLELPDGHGLQTQRILAGNSREVTVGGRRTTVTCPADGADCEITVDEEGDATYAETGGTPTVMTETIMTALTLPDGHSLPVGDTTIAAGEEMKVLDADGTRHTVTCPGGENAQDCVITVTEEDGVKSATYAGTGGTPAVVTGTIIANLPEGVESQEVAAGARTELVGYEKGRITFLSCPGGEDAAACNVVVAEDGSADSRGGAATVEHDTNQMVWQANNGPDGTANGAYARGLVNRLVAASAALAVPADSTTGPGNIPQGSVQGTVVTEPTLSIAWTTEDPAVELTLPTAVFSGLGGLEEDDYTLKNNKKRVGNEKIVGPPSPTGWSARPVSSSFDAGGKTMHGVVYTDMTAPTDHIAVARAVNLVADTDVVAAFGETAPTEAVEIDISSWSTIGTEVKITFPVSALTTLRGGTAQTSITGVTLAYKDTDGDSQTANVAMTCVSTCRGYTESDDEDNPRLAGQWDIDIEGTEDGFYRVFGAWLVLPANSTATGDTSYNLGSFAYSNQLAGVGTGARFGRSGGSLGAGNPPLDSVSAGTYEFEGPAAGLYMTGTYRGRGSSRGLSIAEVDSFTSKVELEAAFTGSTFSGISGSVTEFENGAGESLGWRMFLNTAMNGPDGTSTANDEVFAGDTTLEAPGGENASGKWSSQLYYDADETAGLGFSAGTFNAATDVADEKALHVIGAFVADRTDD